MGTIVGNSECPNCKSIGRDKTGNHLILFEDGGAYCNRCGYKELSGTYTRPNTSIAAPKTPEEIAQEVRWVVENSVIRGVKERQILQVSCNHYGVRTGLSLQDGVTPVCTYFPVESEQGIIGYKVITPDKRMWMKGSGKDALFFGAGVVPPKGNKLFITEGEWDALSLYQVLREYGKKEWINSIAVVSLRNGAGSAHKEMIRNRELIEGYKEVVLCFDMDPPGVEAVEKVLTVLPRDKVQVAKYQLKDCNDMLKAGLGKELYFNVLQSSKPRPEKIISGDDITIEDLMTPLKPGIRTIYPVLNNKLHGFRYGDGGGELSVFCAGSGMGKTTAAREIMYDFNANHNLRLGHIFLEEQYRKTGQSYIALDNNVPLAALREDPSIVDKEAFQQSRGKLISNGRCFFMKHWGSIDSAELMDYMWHFSKVEGTDFIMLDHISLVVSGNSSSSEGERKDLDILMTRLAAFCEESGTSVIAIVHLKRPERGSFNDGTRISLSHLRGSAAIEQLSHNIIAIEGNQSGATPNARTLRVLKNREWGDIGLADTVYYNPTTGRLLPSKV